MMRQLSIVRCSIALAALGSCLLLAACNPNQPPVPIAEESTIAEVASPAPPPPEREAVPVLLRRIDGHKILMPSLLEALAEAATGESILIPPGHHLGNHTVSRPITLIGVGPSPEIMLQGTNDTTLDLECTGASVRNVTLRPPQFQPDGEFVAVTLAATAKGVIAESCLIEGSTQTAVYSTGGSLTLLDSYVYGCRHHTTVGAYHGEIIMKRCVVTNNAGRGLHLYDAYNSVIADCEFEGNRQVGVVVRAGRGIFHNVWVHHNSPQNFVVTEGGVAEISDSLLHDSANANLGVVANSTVMVTRTTLASPGHSSMRVLGGSWAQLFDVEIDGSDRYAIGVFEQSRLDASKLDVRDTWGIWTHGQTTVNITNSRFQRNLRSLVFEDYARGNITNCVIEKSGWVGVLAGGCGEPTVVNCIIENGERYGVEGGRLGIGSFRNCVIRNNRAAGVLVRDQAYPTFIDCLIEDNAQGGIRVQRGARPQFTGCEIRDNGGTGVTARTGATPTLIQCRVVGSRGHGVLVTSDSWLSCQQVTVADSTLDDWRVMPGGTLLGDVLDVPRPTAKQLAGAGAMSLHVNASDEAAYPTLLDAIDASLPGATITLRPGIHRGRHDIPHELTIVGEGSSEEVIIEFHSNIVIRTDGPPLRLENLTVRQPGGRWIYWNNEIDREENLRATIHAAHASLEIVGCRLRSAHGPAIMLEGALARGLIRDSVLFDSARGGVHLQEGARVEIHDSEIIDSPWAGVLAGSGTTALIEDSQITGHEWYAISLHERSTGRVVNSILTGNEESTLSREAPETWDFVDCEM